MVLMAKPGCEYQALSSRNKELFEDKEFDLAPTNLKKKIYFTGLEGHEYAAHLHRAR